MRLKAFKLVLAFILLTQLRQNLLSQTNGPFDAYKYAVLMPSFNSLDGKERDPYGIEQRALEGLRKTGITTLHFDNAKSWPKEVLANECNIILITLQINQLPNSWNCGSIKIVGRNCNDEIVYEEIQRAKNALCYAPYECCWPKWADAALNHFTNIKYNYKPNLNKLKKDYPKVEETNETEETLKNYFSKGKLDPIEGIYKSYQDEQISYYKIGIKKYNDKYKAIIIESDNNIWKIGEVKAEFEPTSINGAYSTKWYSGAKQAEETFAILENKSILKVEFKNLNNNSKTISQFIKTYPSEITNNYDDTPKAKSSGSGFFVSSDGVIATNSHVVEGAKEIVVTIERLTTKEKFKAKIILNDKTNDIALIKIEDSEFKHFSQIPYDIKENVDLGEKVFTIGYPLSDIMGNNLKVSDGIISSKTGISDDIRYYQISIPLLPGNSGGPLFDSEGNIIGITSARLNGESIGTQVENVGYAIKGSYLMSILNMLPNSKTQSSSNNSKKNLELKELINTLKTFVCFIEVSQ